MNSFQEKTQILVISEEEDVRKQVERSLASDEQFKIIGSVESGQAGLTVAQEQRPQIILIDRFIPENHIEIILNLRTLLPECGIFVIIRVTDPSIMRRELLFGANSFLNKPIIPDELIKSLRRLTDKPNGFPNFIEYDNESQLKLIITEIAEELRLHFSWGLEHLLANDYIFTNPNGTVMTKWEFISRIRTDNRRMVDVTYSDLAIQIYENTATMTGRYAETEWINSGQQVSAQRRFLCVFAKYENQWKIVTEQHAYME